MRSQWLVKAFCTQTETVGKYLPPSLLSYVSPGELKMDFLAEGSNTFRRTSSFCYPHFINTYINESFFFLFNHNFINTSVVLLACSHVFIRESNNSGPDWVSCLFESFRFRIHCCGFIKVFHLAMRSNDFLNVFLMFPLS